MKITLQRRLVLSFVPIIIVIAVIGMAGQLLLDRLGNASNAILRENYDSVVAMVGLNEALERIDSSYQFAIHGKGDSFETYRTQWVNYDKNLEEELRNVTIPGEAELARRLADLTVEYHREGDRFFALTNEADRKSAYFGSKQKGGLLALFNQIKEVSGSIRELNQRHMEAASRKARDTALASQIWFAAGLGGAAVMVAFLVRRSVRSVAKPMAELKKAAAAIGKGDLDYSVNVSSNDEFGELAETFNLMARQLRDLRQSHLSRYLRAQQTSQATIDSFPDPVLVIDVQGRVEMANPAARKLLGVLPGEKSGPEAFPWIPPEPLQQPLREALQYQRPFTSLSFDQAVTFHSGNDEFVFLPHVLPIRDPYGVMLGAAVVLNDVTRFRLMDQFKSDLVATASHELKTPLTSFRMAVHILLEESIGPLNDKQTELLVDARDNAERLLNLIEHLLSLARLENTKNTLAVEPVAPLSLLQRVAESARSRAEDKHLEIVVAADNDLPEVAVDPRRMAAALGNLVENAITYTPPGGRITISATRGQDNEIILSVADTGIGIPAEYLPHVFDKFFRVPGQSVGNGTGLGLAIVKEVVAAHRGHVACESVPKHGTTFRLYLPAREKAPQTQD